MRHTESDHPMHNQANVVLEGSTDQLRAFWRVLLGQSASAFGSGLTAFALAVWVYQQTHSLLQFGTVVFVAAAATALTGPVLGVLCDRYPLRQMMLLSDGAAAVLTCGLFVLVWLGDLQLWQLMIVVALDAVFSALHQIAYRSAVPMLVSREQLTRANGLVETGLSLSSLCAPLAAGALLAGSGLHGILVIDLLTFVFAVVTLGSVRFPERQASQPVVGPTDRVGNQTNVKSVLAELRAALSYVWQRPELCWLWLVVLAASFVLAGIQVLFSPMILAMHSPAVLGVLTTAGGAGMALAGILLSMRRNNFSARAVLWCQAGLAVPLFLLSFMHSVWWLAACAFFGYGFSQCGSILARVLWQTEVTASMRGRVFALLSTSSAALMPVAILGVPWFAESIVQPWLVGAGNAASLRTVFGAGAGGAAAAVIALLALSLGLFSLCIGRNHMWRQWRPVNDAESLSISP